MVNKSLDLQLFTEKDLLLRAFVDGKCVFNSRECRFLVSLQWRKKAKEAPWLV